MASNPITSTAFNPEIWSAEMMEEMKRQMGVPTRPKRTKGAQLLRDAALGHPEYPEKAEYDRHQAMTATELVMRQQQAEMELKRIQHQIEPSIYKALFGDEKWRSRT